MQKELCCNPVFFFFFSPFFFFSILSRWLGDKLKGWQNYLLCTRTFFACLEVFWGVRGEKRGERSYAVAHTLSLGVAPCLWRRTVCFFFFLPVLGAAVPLGAGSHIKRHSLPKSVSSWLGKSIKREKIRQDFLFFFPQTFLLGRSGPLQFFWIRQH